MSFDTLKNEINHSILIHIWFVQAFIEGIKVIEPGVHEYEVDALFDYVLRLNGSPRAAFPTMVASGPNINILHYDAGHRLMLDGDLVMIDFGVES